MSKTATRQKLIVVCEVYITDQKDCIQIQVGFVPAIRRHKCAICGETIEGTHKVYLVKYEREKAAIAIYRAHDRDCWETLEEKCSAAFDSLPTEGVSHEIYLLLGNQIRSQGLVSHLK